MARFVEGPEQYKTYEMIEHISSSIQRYATVNLFKFIRDEKGTWYLPQVHEFELFILPVLSKS